MLTSPDFKELLSLFKKYEVRYMIVGGYAVMRYTEPRFTKNLKCLSRLTTTTLEPFTQHLQSSAHRSIISRQKTSPKKVISTRWEVRLYVSMCSCRFQV